MSPFPKSLQRIAIFGGAGSGKSRLANELGAILGTKVTHLDDLFWGPHWKEPKAEVFHAKVKRMVEQDRWVIDGNYSKVRPMVLKRASYTIILDLPYPVIVWRLIARTITRNTRFKIHESTPLPIEVARSGTKEDIPRAIIELATYAWRFKRRGKKRILVEVFASLGERRCIILRNSNDMKRFLEVVEKAILER